MAVPTPTTSTSRIAIEIPTISQCASAVYAARAEHMMSAGLTPKAIHEVLGGRPMPAEEKQFWQRELEAQRRHIRRQQEDIAVLDPQRLIVDLDLWVHTQRAAQVALLG